MAYNNGFPVGYQQMYYPQQFQAVQPNYAQQPQQNNGIIWVSGEAGAKAYLVAPNTTVQLWDSEAQTIFLKSADASGMPSMKILDYTIRDMTPSNGPITASNQSPINAQDYALRTDLEALATQISALRAEVDGMTVKRSRKEVATNE